MAPLILLGAVIAAVILGWDDDADAQADALQSVFKPPVADKPKKSKKKNNEDISQSPIDDGAIIVPISESQPDANSVPIVPLTPPE